MKGETYVVTEIPAKRTFAQAATGAEALRASADQVAVTWDAVMGLADATYTVERKIADGEYVEVAAGRATTELRLCWGLVSTPGNPISVEDLRGTGSMDDRDARVKHEGGWGAWNDPKHHNGTIKFLQTSQGGEKSSLRFAGTGASFISPKNTSFGSVDFYIDGEMVTDQSYSLYSSTDVSKQEVVIAEGASFECSYGRSRGNKRETRGFEQHQAQVRRLLRH